MIKKLLAITTIVAAGAVTYFNTGCKDKVIEDTAEKVIEEMTGEKVELDELFEISKGSLDDLLDD